MVGTVPRSLADWMFVRCFTGAVLVAGALLSRRTVSAALRVLDQSASFAVYHRVLSTARRRAHRLLHLLVAAFVRDGPVVIDDTIERRWGTKIKASTGRAARKSRLPFSPTDALRRLPAAPARSQSAPVTLSKRCLGCASCCSRPLPGPAAAGRCRS